MAIISFWSGEERESAQTLSMVAVATHMAIEHNARILVIDARFQDDTLERCYWKLNPSKDLNKTLNTGKMDIASGAEGLVSAIASNRTTPEIIPNYTKVVLKNRLDVLCGLQTDDYEDFQKALRHYQELVKVANKYYDYVFIDLSKTLDEATTRAILEVSTIMVYTMPQNLQLIDKYIERRSQDEFVKKDNVIPLLTNVDENSKYNVKNATRYVSNKQELANVLHNTTFMECACEGSVSSFFLKTRLSSNAQDKNGEFIKSVNGVCKQILALIEELKYKL